MIDMENRPSAWERGERPRHARAKAAEPSRPRHRLDRHDARSERPTVGMVGLALAAAAGVAAIGMLGTRIGATSRRNGGDPNRGSAGRLEPEVERSITIEDVPKDDLYRRWRDPDTLRRIMAPFAEVQSTGDGRTRWNAGHDLGAWDMHLADDQPGERLRWMSHDAGASIREVSVRFDAAAGNRGTVVVLRVCLDPPGGMVGRIATRMLGNTVPSALASKSLRYFKALVQTGEIPTTERQPAARPDPR